MSVSSICCPLELVWAGSMVAIQKAKCKSLLKIVTFSINAWAGEG